MKFAASPTYGWQSGSVEPMRSDSNETVLNFEETSCLNVDCHQSSIGKAFANRI